MKISKDFVVGMAVTIAFMLIGAVAFVGSGVYNIGADDHHTAPVLTVIQELRERSIGARADAIDVPSLEGPSKISAGAARYSKLCVGCHQRQAKHFCSRGDKAVGWIVVRQVKRRYREGHFKGEGRLMNFQTA